MKLRARPCGCEANNAGDSVESGSADSKTVKFCGAMTGGRGTCAMLITTEYLELIKADVEGNDQETFPPLQLFSSHATDKRVAKRHDI